MTQNGVLVLPTAAFLLPQFKGQLVYTLPHLKAEIDLEILTTSLYFMQRLVTTLWSENQDDSWTLLT